MKQLRQRQSLHQGHVPSLARPYCLTLMPIFFFTLLFFSCAHGFNLSAVPRPNAGCGMEKDFTIGVTASPSA